jgi:hypothetical protein
VPGVLFAGPFDFIVSTQNGATLSDTPARVTAMNMNNSDDETEKCIDVLRNAGLDEAEATLVTQWRQAKTDRTALAPLRRFADRQWRQLELSDIETTRERREAGVALAFAVTAAVVIKLPDLMGIAIEREDVFYARNLSLFAFPMVAGFFLWVSGASTRTWLLLAAAFVAAAIVVNQPWFARGGDFDALTGLHLPIALWLAVGVAHAGGRWNDVGARMAFVRFAGGMFIFCVLVALGGMVFTALMMALFESIGMSLQVFFERWLLPCGAMAAVVIAAWQVDARQHVLGLIAPLLTRLFTPLFTLLLVAFLIAIPASGRGLEFHRELIFALDVVLAVVLGLVLYALSARDPERGPGPFDALQCMLVIAALLVDAAVLWTMAARISEFGFTPNRVAALGMNLVLLVNLSWSALLCFRFVRGSGEIAALVRWQMRYLPVHATWAALVVVVLPLVFPRS